MCGEGSGGGVGVKALAVCHGEERTTFNEEAGLIVCVMGKDSKEFSTPVWKRNLCKLPPASYRIPPYQNLGAGHHQVV